MPELLRIGKLKFIIRAERKVRHHRPHIHVIKAECEAVFSLDHSVECLGYVEFRESDVRKIKLIVERYRDLFLEEWSNINEEN